MLTLELSAQESFNEETQEFLTLEPVVLELEHSLVSLSKWESITEKPFLGNTKRTNEELYLYIKCMSVNADIPDEVMNRLTQVDLNEINAYLQRSQTATTFKESTSKRGNSTGEAVTSELIYYWMTALQIPFECQYWNINRLITLIRVCNIKNQPAKKMSKREALTKMRSLNAERRAAREQLGGSND